MASDFFYPNTGGVEAHIWQLSQRLKELGHKVVVITHAYGSRRGVRYLPNDVKVYYLPFALYPKQNIIWPFVFNTLAYVREILVKERIDIVHGHSAFSPLAHEIVFHAKTLNINTVFTDHSLFGFNDFGSVVHYTLCKQSLLDSNHIICVSHVGCENQALHLEVDKGRTIPIAVIPNAVDTQVFTPDPSQRDPSKITIIVNSRLVYRKGIDLLAVVLPKICQLDERIHFIVAGDGPKRTLLEAAVRQHNLEQRVALLGSVPHDQVRDVLVKGDIFLNTSLIEAFCMAIVEAASCGLRVVSTNVGGLPHVLPPKLIKLTEPSVDGLLEGVRKTIKDLNSNRFVTPSESHNIVKDSYSWKDVAKRTEQVYTKVLQEPPAKLQDRLKTHLRSRSVCSWLFVFITIIDYLLLMFLDWYSPRESMDQVAKPTNSATINGNGYKLANGNQSSKPGISALKSDAITNSTIIVNGYH